MKGLAVTVAFVVLLTGALEVAADLSYVSKYVGDLGQLMFTTLAQRDGSIVGATSMTLDGSGSINWAASAAYQSTVSQSSRITSLDSCMSMNTLGELLVVFAAHRLRDALPQSIPSLDNPIPVAFSPLGVNLTSNGVGITYKQLMRHTSTILDVGWTPSTSTVGDFNKFVESYFVLSGTSSLNLAKFSTSTKPGAPESFKFARANIALLAYALGKVISGNLNVINGQPYASLQDYITQTILNPLGCANTFFLNTDGSAPGITSEPSYSGSFSSIPYQSASSYAAFYQGCIADQLGGLPLLHPAFWSDYMGYTTAADVTRLLYGLFYNPNFMVTTAQMKEATPVTNGRVSGQVQQALGLEIFDGTAICAAGISRQVMTSCPSSNTTSVFGYVTNRDFVDRGFFCANVSSSSGQLCTSVSILYSQSSQRDSTNLFSLTAAAWQDLAGTISLTTALSSATVSAATALAFGTPTPQLYHNGATTDDQWFGVYAFLGVYFTLMGTYFGTVFIQWLLMPAALASMTETGGATKLGFSGTGPTAKQEPSILSQY